MELAALILHRLYMRVVKVLTHRDDSRHGHRGALRLRWPLPWVQVVLICTVHRYLYLNRLAGLAQDFGLSSDELNLEGVGALLEHCEDRRNQDGICACKVGLLLISDHFLRVCIQYTQVEGEVLVLNAIDTDDCGFLQFEV